MRNLEIVINKKNHKIILNRDDIIEIKHTHDGLVFNLKGNMYIYITDINMPVNVKNRYVVSFETFDNANLIFNIHDYNNPVKVEVPSQK
jgi:hypothetical protein